MMSGKLFGTFGALVVSVVAGGCGGGNLPPQRPCPQPGSIELGGAASVTMGSAAGGTPADDARFESSTANGAGNDQLNDGSDAPEALYVF